MSRKAKGDVIQLNQYTPPDARAIFEDLSVYGAYPKPVTSGWISETIDAALNTVPIHVACAQKPLRLMLECFMQISGCELHSGPWDLNQKTWELFLGALQSPRFLAATANRRYNYTRNLLLLLSKSGWEPDRIWLERMRPSTCLTTGALGRCRDRFERRTLKQRAVDYWMHWPATNLSGHRTWLDLVQIHHHFGQKYTREFYSACANYFARQRSDFLPMKRELPAFMVKNKRLCQRARVDPTASEEFFKGFVTDCIENKSEDIKIETVIASLRGSALLLIKSLISAGIFEEPEGGVPRPPPRYVLPFDTHVKIVDGVPVRAKSITHFSTLPFSDESALKHKAEQVKQEIEVVEKWAKAKIEVIWKRYLNRVNSWQSGVPYALRSKGSDGGKSVEAIESNPRADDAASLRYYGYLVEQDCRKEGHATLPIIYRRRLDGAAEELAIPTVGMMLPFMACLVIENNEITPSFLETLELYNRDGARVGFGTTQGGYFLRGFKRRRGKNLAQQILMPGFDSARIVLKVICLTAVTRRYLQKKNDDSARFLFLSTGRAFGYPNRIRDIACSITSQPAQVATLSEELQSLAGCSAELAQQISENFSLPALRAQVVTKMYLERHNTAEVARALGHKIFNFRQLCRYLPIAVIKFFMDRWIRIHQTRIIVEVLVDSPHQLAASGLEDEDALTQFLENHCMPLSSPGNPYCDLSVERSEELNGATTLIGIDEAIMTIFCSISLALKNSMRPVRRAVAFWVNITEPLISEIEKLRESRPDLASYLDLGWKSASLSLVERVLYD